MSQAVVRSWLLKQPRPAAVRLKQGTEIQTLPVNPGVTWASIAQTILAFEPDTIEALDDKAGLIRASSLVSIVAGEDSEAPTIVDVGPVRAALDAETARYKIFAEHIAEAYRFATGVAFERMVDLFGAVNRRSESLEKSLEATHRLLGKAYQEQIDTALEHASAEDPVTNLVGAFMQGANQAAVEAVANKGPSNGKAKA